MKIYLMLVAAMVTASLFGQGLRPMRRLLQREHKKFNEKYPEGTNEFGRTFAQEKAEQRWLTWRTIFLKENPNGKNRFHRSPEEQYEYEIAFDLDTFLGFELGKDIGDTKTVKLVKPYRLFDSATLCTTAKGRVYAIRLEKEFDDASFTSLSNEVQRLVANIENAYKVQMRRGGLYASNLGSYTTWGGHLAWGGRIYGVGPHPKTAFDVSGNYDLATGHGVISVCVCKREMNIADYEQHEAEKKDEIAAKQKDVSLPEAAGIELLVSKVSKATEASADDQTVANHGEEGRASGKGRTAEVPARGRTR